MLGATTIKAALAGLVMLLGVAPLRVAADAATFDANTYGIVVPVFAPHFDYLKRFLSSCVSHVSDIADASILVVTSDAGESVSLAAALAALELESHGVQLKVVSVADLYAHYKITSPTSALFEQNKFAIQATKKLYGLRYLAKPRMLWLDAETVVLRKTSIKTMMDAYFKDPYVMYSHVTVELGTNNPTSLGWNFLEVIHPALGIVTGNADPYGTDWPKFLNFMTYQGWFTEAAVINDLFASVEKRSGKALADMVTEARTSQFETLIIFTYLYINQRKYPSYKFISLEDNLPLYLREKTADYLLPHYVGSYPNGMECMLNHVTEAILPGMVKFMNDYGMSFFRYNCAGTGVPLLPQILKQVPTLTIQVCSEEVYALPADLQS